MSTQFTHNDLATELLNKARTEAIAQVTGLKANKYGLAKLAMLVRAQVLDQVELGLWAKLGVHERDEMTGLRVIARRGTALVEPPIVIDYDFKNTKLARLVIYRTMRAPGTA